MSPPKPLQTLVSCVNKVKKIDPDLRTQAVLLLLAVMDDPGHPQVHYQDKFKIPRSTASRYVSQLGPWAAFNTPGLGLIDAQENPQNRREKQLWLTPKGQRLAQDLIAELTR